MLNIQCGSREFNLPYAVTKTIGEVQCAWSFANFLRVSPGSFLFFLGGGGPKGGTQDKCLIVGFCESSSCGEIFSP